MQFGTHSTICNDHRPDLRRAVEKLQGGFKGKDNSLASQATKWIAVVYVYIRFLISFA